VIPPLVPAIDRLALTAAGGLSLDVQGKQRPYRTRDGRFFVRIGADKHEATHQELAALLDEARPFDYENLPAVGATVADIDEAHLWSFMREFVGGAFDETTAKGYPTGEVLERTATRHHQRRRDRAHLCRAVTVWL
jgi:hypothetical protein